MPAEAGRFENDPDAVAEVLIRLVGRKLIEVPSPLEAGLNLQWGTHLCQFYRSQEELLELVVPFFNQGVREHERCIWVVTPPLGAEAARAALLSAWPPFENHADQVSVHDYQDWYLERQTWKQEERRALDQGYLGLRVAGDAKVGAVFAGLRVKALCTYPTERCEVTRLRQALANHDAAYVKQRDSWERIIP